MITISQTVEQVRDAVPEPLSTLIESAVWTLTHDRAVRAAWREYRGEGSLSVLALRLADREFGRVLDLPFGAFLDELGGELADEIEALLQGGLEMAA